MEVVTIRSEKKYHIFKGTELLKDTIDKMNKPIVYFDPDVDGMISGLLVCMYLRKLNKTFDWYVNSCRSHDWGIPIDKVKGRDIIAVDFQIPKTKVTELVKAGCNLVSMDHHINQRTFIRVNNKDKIGFVINNQYSAEEKDSNYLSGAGVVFESIVAICPEFDTLQNRALVGLTLLSDICEIENPLAKGYLEDLYNHKMKGYIKYLIENTIGDKDFKFGVPRMDRNYVDFKFSPAINSCLRFNRENDVVRFFLGSGKLDLSYHKRQKDLVKAMMQVTTVREFSHLRVCFFKDWEVETDEDREVMPSFVGLVASKFLDGTKSAITYCISKRKNGELYLKRASFRGNVNGLDYLSATKDYMKGVGHPSAFGILELSPDRYTFDKINSACELVESTSTGNTKSITPANNLSVFDNRFGAKFAEYNAFCLSQHRKYVRYVGNNIQVKREGAEYREYSVDGIKVMCFDMHLDFSNGVIFPIIERGYKYYYLQGGY